MNRLILRYPYQIAAVILLIFGWVVVQRLARGVDAIIPLALAAVIVWPLGTLVFVYLWPRITVGGFKRALTGRGLGGGPIPVNTVYAVPLSPSQSAQAANVVATGTDDILYLGGWLDVTGGPRVLHVPSMDDRYYSVQFTDPASGANFAYVGTRATGSREGDFLLPSGRICAGPTGPTQTAGGLSGAPTPGSGRPRGGRGRRR